jgi:hypothetical protein
MATSDFHLFAVPIAIKDYDEGISLTTLDNDLADGYESSVLFGSANGVRRFKIGMPTLTGSRMDNRTAVTINGETTTFENYVWELFWDTKRRGIPFAFQSARNGQFYLVKFADNTLTYSRMLTKLYSTGVELKQVRRRGQTVYDVSHAPNLYDYYHGGITSGISGTIWGGTVVGHDLTDAGGTTNVTSGLGTHTILRFDGVNDYLTDDGTYGGLTQFYEAFLVMKIRAAAFGNNAGVLTRVTSTAAGILVGDTGTNHFFNFGVGLEYELNGVSYPESNMVAPMNMWGIVRVRSNSLSPIAMDGLQVGKDRGFASRYAPMDLAALVVFSDRPPTSVSYEIYEWLAVEFGVTG